MSRAANLKYRLLTVIRVCVSNRAWPEGGIDEPKNRAIATENTAMSRSTRTICNLLYSSMRKNIQKAPRINNGPLYISENIRLISPYCTTLATA